MEGLVRWVKDLHYYMNLKRSDPGWAEREVDRITIIEARKVIDKKKPEGLYLAKVGSSWWMTIDNLTCDEIWTEYFHWKFQAINWLHRRVS